jgi:UDP-glucuronate 4-epimerase
MYESRNFMRVLVTGAAGFIGFYTAEALLARGCEVAGFDNLNSYYDPALKRNRLSLLDQHKGFSFIEGSLEDAEAVRALFSAVKPQRVIHLAAQAGVRYSITNPQVYIQSNITGFLNILEECRRGEIEHLVFASSSSVYGVNAKLPFSEHDVTDSPASLYGATKKSNELMAHAYAHLYGLPTTGLRFFTVYGPWGRPDMAPFLFTKNIFEGVPIDVYNNGRHARDFTYISDIVDGIMRVASRVPVPKQAAGGEQSTGVPLRIYNIGNNNPVQLMDFIACIEEAAGKKAVKNFLPKQPGDVLATYAAIDDLEADTGFKPTTPIETGIPRLVTWYREYYR